MKYLYLTRNMIFALMISLLIFRYFFMNEFDPSYEAKSHFLLGIVLISLLICQLAIFFIKRRLWEKHCNSFTQIIIRLHLTCFY